MSICPMLKEECTHERCSWWYKEVHVETNKCIIPLLKATLSSVGGTIHLMRQDIKNVQQDIIDVHNELVDIEHKLVDIENKLDD